MNIHDMDKIHASLVNGQRRQMTEQINNYDGSLYDFWHDYKEYLNNDDATAYNYFADAVVSYHRITNRYSNARPPEQPSAGPLP